MELQCHQQRKWKKRKPGDKSEKVASGEDAKDEDFGDHHTDLDDYDDINLWVGKSQTNIQSNTREVPQCWQSLGHFIILHSWDFSCLLSIVCL